MDLTQILLRLEQRLLAEATRSDPAEISRLLADDFFEFGASGSCWTKARVVEGLPDQPFIPRTISEFVARPLSENTALVTYHCRTYPTDQRRPTISMRSSIWRKQDEQWQMIFHQGTNIPDGE